MDSEDREDAVMMGWLAEHLRWRRGRDIADQDQMLAARRDFEPTLPIPDDTEFDGIDEEGFRALWSLYSQPLLFTEVPTTQTTFRKMTGSVILTPFLRDESLAREANEFGY